MSDYYLYLPCPGSSGIQFYSNVNPNNYVGPIIRFNTNTGSSKIQLGNCFSVSIVSAEFFPPGLVNIDWNAVTYSVFNECTECEELVECTGCPPGYTFNGVDCVASELVPATYSGGTLTLETGARNSAYGMFGLRLYPDITAVLPVVGNGASYNVVGTSGFVAPIINSLTNALWGGVGIGVCDTGCTGGRLNEVGLWGPGAIYNSSGCTPAATEMYPQNNWIEINYCFDSGASSKQFLIGLAGDNKVKITLDSVDIITLDSSNNGWNGPYMNWHVFPVTISPGNHTLKVSGYNLADIASFGAEIYDISLGAFQANLTTPASGSNCGNIPADLEPYIIFSTRDYVGQVVADPDNPGVWSCPVGTLDYCNGGPQCLTETTITPEPCAYLLTSCCNPNLTYIANIEGFTTPGVYYYTGIDNVGIPYGCYDIQEYTGATVIFTAISLDSLFATSCGVYPCDTFCLDCDCVRVRFKPADAPGGPGTTSVSYFTCNDGGPSPIPIGATYEVPNDGSWGEKVCARQFIFLTNIYETQNAGACSSDNNPITPTFTCPNYYTLVSCKNPAVTICVNNDLSQYLGSIVTINGYSGNCYYVQESVDPCPEPVNVTIVQVYDTCEECQEETYYKLSNCNNQNIVIYTDSDFSTHVGQVVSVSEYPDDCWTVSEVNTAINIIPLTFVNSFPNCAECLKQYYILEDCNLDNPNPSIITGTDLSAHVGEVITLDFCPDICWLVSETDNTVGAEAVSINESFTTCEECLDSFPCVCSTVTNTATTAITFAYIDCEYNQQTIRVSAGATSVKICLIKWIDNSNGLFKYYGDCVDGVCPTVLRPKKKIRPGYNTPGCSIEKYEKYMCNFSESVYMQVMVDKYGIEPCCGDDSYKWEIKKELIQLKAIEDPTFTCQQLIDCDCTTSIAGLSSCIPTQG